MMRYELVFEGECGNDNQPFSVTWRNKLPTRWEILNLPILVNEWLFYVDGVFTFKAGGLTLKDENPHVLHPETIGDNDGIPDLDDEYGDFFAGVILDYLRGDLKELKAKLDVASQQSTLAT